MPLSEHRPAEPERPPALAQAKLDQLKELYLTAAAIGEDALVRHFEEVSQRQRALIREYFRAVRLRAQPRGDEPP
jgi:hypothetical protein